MTTNARGEKTTTMVFIPKTYPRAAGLQSEISKMAVVHIAHLENDYRRQVHMAKMDMKNSIRELKHNRAMLKRSVKHYTSKLREYKRAKENKYYDSLLREKVTGKEMDIVTAKAGDTDTSGSGEYDADEKKTVRPDDCTDSKPSINRAEKDEGKNVLLNFELDIDSKHEVSSENSAVTETGQTRKEACEEANREAHKPEDDRVSGKKLSLEEKSEQLTSHEQDTPKEGLVSRISRKRRSGVVNLVNITKLQYRSNVRALFRAVDVLARIHGVKQPEPKEQRIPDLRKISQEQQLAVTTRDPLDHLTLPSQYLYNMKYGYSALEDAPVRTASSHALNEDQNSDVSQIRNRGSFFHSNNTTAGVTSPIPLPRISRTELPSTEFLDKPERRKLSRNSTQSVSESSKRSSRSSYNAHNTDEIPSPHVKLPVLKQRISVSRKSREGVKISRPQLYPDSYFERKFSAGDCDDVKWDTAFAKLKHVHFIDTSGL